MKACKMKKWLVAALVMCAGILSANAGENFVYAEREFSLLPPEDAFVWAEEEFELLPSADDFIWDEKGFWLMPDGRIAVTLPTGNAGYAYVVSNLTVGVEIEMSGAVAGGATYDLPIGAHVAICCVPSEGYVVSGTNPYDIPEVTETTVVDPADLPKGEKGTPVGEGSYVFVKDGNCTIFGTGSVTSLPAGFDRNSIKSVTVEDGITEIGTRLFKKCRKLNTVTLGKDVVSVETNAFYLCVALERITVGNAEAVESLKGAVVYQTAIDKDGKPYPIPYIEAPGYKNELYGTDRLKDPDWVLLDSGKPMEASGYHFFKFVLKKIEE